MTEIREMDLENWQRTYEPCSVWKSPRNREAKIILDLIEEVRRLRAKNEALQGAAIEEDEHIKRLGL